MDCMTALLSTNSINVSDGDTEQSSMEMTSVIDESSSTQQRAPQSRSWNIDEKTESAIFIRYGKHHHTLYLMFLLFVVLLMYAMSEWEKISTGSDPNLSKDSIEVLNERNTTQRYFGAESLNVNDPVRTRVVYFIIDGLRFDAIQTNPSLNALVTSPWFANHSLILNMSAQVPTISLPNWATLVTSARPSLLGRLGNGILTALPFDSIFTSAMSVGLRNGVVGDAWWSILLNGHLTPFDGDGTSPTFTNDFGDVEYTHGHSDYYKDIAYNQRLHDAINRQTIRQQPNGSNATVRFDYDLFLSYFDDVDAKSHAFGPHSLQVQSAINDKIAFVRTGIATIGALDATQRTRTVFILTSDHGHVNVGGHGGDVSVLRTVPCIIYAKDSQLASRKNLLPDYTTFDSVDIATSITAILGVPAPRQSEGSFISPLISSLVPPSKWNRLYFDLFKQKQALVLALLTQWYQSSLKSQYKSLLADNAGVNASVTELHNSIRILSTLIEESKARRIASVMTGNVIFSSLIAMFVIVSICGVFHRSTFLDLHIILPRSLLYICTRRCQRSAYSRSLAANIETQNNSRSRSIEYLHRTFLLLAVVIIGVWWSLMMFVLLVIYAHGYRSTDEWRWQYTLMNSGYDRRVLIIGVCICGSFVVTALITLTTWCIFRLKTMHVWLSRFFDSPSFDRETKGAITSFYYLSLYVAFLFNVNVILFHFSQSYHCLWLPSICPINIITQRAWSARFQSLTLSFMMLPAMLSLIIIDSCLRYYLFRRISILPHRKHEQSTMDILVYLASMRTE